jgi:hypothetical protein
MSASHLVVVPAKRDAESAADRIKRLQAEARQLAREQVEALSAALEQVSQMAAEIADGGDIYPVGAREFAKRLVDDAGKQAAALAAIAERD